MKDVLIIGGGLAGLTSALALAKAGLNAVLIEKKTYPFHKVCGEYVSNEARPYLETLGLDIDRLQPAFIRKLILGSSQGKSFQLPLDMGGFGVSRYRLDNYFYEVARAAGVEFHSGVEAKRVETGENSSFVSLSNGKEITARVVIGAYGKRTSLDRQLDRDFFKKHSPYLGIKYHVKLDFPIDTIAIYTFKDGYCGLNKIEDDKYCLCYLGKRDDLRSHGNIQTMEEEVLFRNPQLRSIFTNAVFLYDKPEVINEISFDLKELVKDHILFCGDSAGMIAPLCGNGMAMAIHSAKIVSEEIIDFIQLHNDRGRMENNYRRKWKEQFARRLWIGRKIQTLFGNERLSGSIIGLVGRIQQVARMLVKQTHGEEF
ncbi:MAG: NAD(P)/FAD-dependent oxidoreductase [Bacteroidota bacterium]|nr:NAD(P)/FAD-dependent oxidoreductase [Bacteroidota bacterium]